MTAVSDTKYERCAKKNGKKPGHGRNVQREEDSATNLITSSCNSKIIFFSFMNNNFMLKKEMEKSETSGRQCKVVMSTTGHWEPLIKFERK